MIKKPINEDLRRRGIDIEHLWVRSHGSLEDIFHPSTKYTYIERFPPGTSEPDPKIPGLVTRHTFGSIKLRGCRRSYFREKYFEAYVAFLCSAIIPFDIAVFENPGLLLNPDYRKQREPIYRERLLHIDEKLKILETYFLQRMEAQQPESKYTYRTKTEIKSK